MRYPMGRYSECLEKHGTELSQMKVCHVPRWIGHSKKLSCIPHKFYDASGSYTLKLSTTSSAATLCFNKGDTVENKTNFAKVGVAFL